jgi:histone deacetylase 1/2
VPIAPTLPAAGSSTAPEAQASPVSTEETGRRITRLQQGIRKPKVYTDGTVRNGNLAVTTKPNTLHEALANENWKHAMDHEYSALMRNQTWHLVPPSKGKNIIDCKWIYKVKKKSDGSTNRYKA